MRARSPVVSSAALLLLAGCGGAATDDTGGAAENAPPGAPTVHIEPDAPRTDDALVVVLDAPATDAEGDPVVYTYRWAQDGLPRPDLVGDTVPASETTRGETWSVSVVPDDGEALGTPASAAATIQNTPPAATVTLAPASPGTGDALTAAAAGTDADGDAVTLAYAWLLDGVEQADTGDDLSADRTAFGETWTVRVTPSDGEGPGTPAEASVTIGNEPPVVLDVRLSPDAPSVGDAVVAAVEASDPDGHPVSFTYTWFVDGVEVASGPDATLPPGGFSKHQRIGVEVVPDDGWATGEPFLSADVVVANSPPAATAARVSPDPAYEASELSCAGEGFTDPDGDDAAWTYAWTVGGTLVSTDATLDGAAFSKGDAVACAATPWDGEVAGDPVASATVTVSNTPPSIGAAALSTYAPTENDTVSVTLTGATDDDGDAVTYSYAWFVNGAGAGSSATLLANRFAKGDAIYVVVTPADAEGPGSPVTSPLGTAANTPPTVTRLALSHADLYTDDVVSVAATGDDLDGDDVTFTYDWYVDGRARGSYTSASLDGADHFSRGETVWVVVTPDDGDDSGAPATSDALSVANSPPDAPTIALSPTEPEAGDALTCAVVAPSADPDGDAVRYAFAWDVDGEAFLGASDAETDSTVDADDVPTGSAWTCAVAATDGDATSAVAEASVTVCADGDGDGYTDAACGGDDCRDDDDALHPYDADLDGVVDGCGWRDLAVVGDQACAIDSDEALVCWGAASPVTPDASARYADISGFFGPACALRTDGALTCWGMEAAGASYGPPSGYDLDAIAIGTQIHVALTTDALVLAWGWNTYASTPTLAGYDGVRAAANYHEACWIDQDGAVDCASPYTSPDNRASPYSDVAVGNGHVCVLREADATAFCFGNDYYGQLDEPADAFATLVAGLETTCGLREDGSVVCWGNDDLGATDVPEGVAFERLAVGYNANYGGSNFCGVTTEQAIRCWGTGSGALERDG